MNDERIPLWRRLLRRRENQEPTVFIQGDASGSVSFWLPAMHVWFSAPLPVRMFRNVETDADTFIAGSQEGAVFEDIRHERRGKR